MTVTKSIESHLKLLRRRSEEKMFVSRFRFFSIFLRNDKG